MTHVVSIRYRLQTGSTPGCPRSDACCHMRQIHAGAALELARVATPVMCQDVCTATTSERAQPKTRHRSGKAVAVGVRTRLVLFAALLFPSTSRGQGARSTRIFGIMRRGSLHSHYRAAASPSRRPSHGLPCMPCRLTFCARVVCRRSLHRRASSAGSCWTLPDTNLDAPAPRVAAGAAPRARVARPRCDALRARCGLMATWSAAGVGERRTLATLRLSSTLLVLGSRVGRSEDRWRECRERVTCVLVK